MFRYLLLILILVPLSALAMGEVFHDDPYDPLMGPRNPRPGAEAYLMQRSDITTNERYALLGYMGYPPVSPELLVKLAEAPSREVRSLVGQNPNTPEVVLEKLAHDPEVGVRQYVAGNSKAPRRILDILAQDPDGNVLWSLQHNPAWIALHGAPPQ